LSKKKTEGQPSLTTPETLEIKMITKPGKQVLTAAARDHVEAYLDGLTVVPIGSVAGDTRDPMTWRTEEVERALDEFRNKF
jgi:hypothetical protein